MWTLAVERVHLAEVSPLTGWPDSYSAGMVDAVLGFRHARATRKVDQ